MTRRLAVIRFWFEGNAFAPFRTGWDEFSRREWRAGPAALAATRGAATELAAVSDFLAAHSDWDATVIRAAAADPGGPIDDPVFETLLAEVRAALAGARWDAVYLSLHGAAITVSRHAPDLELAELVRSIVGPATPIVASFDLHGNPPAALIELLDFASVYRTYPHVDMRDTARRVLEQMLAIVAGRSRPRGALVSLDCVLQSHNMRSDEPLFGGLLAAARASERDGVIEVGLFGGFPYADTPTTRAAVMGFAEGDAAPAREAAGAIAAVWLDKRAAFEPQLIAPAEAFRRALAAPAGLVAVTDPADNPLSGGGGDTPELLRALLQFVPGVPTVFAYFNDPGAVAAAAQAALGASIEVQLGGRLTRDFGAPVRVRAMMKRVGDGRFVNSGPMERGLAVDPGRYAVLNAAGIDVIVTERAVPVNDPAFYAACGIDLDRTRLLVVKAKNHFRAAFRERTVAIIDADVPGPAAADLRALPFKNVRF